MDLVWINMERVVIYFFCSKWWWHLEINVNFNNGIESFHLLHGFLTISPFFIWFVCIKNVEYTDARSCNSWSCEKRWVKDWGRVKFVCVFTSLFDVLNHSNMQPFYWDDLKYIKKYYQTDTIIASQKKTKCVWQKATIVKVWIINAWKWISNYLRSWLSSKCLCVCVWYLYLMDLWARGTRWGNGREADKLIEI